MPDGAGRFPQDFSGPAVLRIPLCLYSLPVRAITRIAQFPTCFQFIAQYNIVVLQPRTCRNMHGLGSFPFARHYLGNHCYFLLLRLLRCFSSARSRIIRHVFNMPGCPIRKSTDQFAFADPRGLSQLITSFFASESLGIPRVPLFTFFTGIAFCYYAAAFDIYTGMLRNDSSGIHRISPHHIRHIPALSLLLSSLVIFFLFQYVKELFFPVS